MDHQPIREKKAICSIKGFRTLALGMTALAVALRTLNLFLYHDAEIGYYRQGAVLPVVLRVLLIVATLLFAVLPFFLCERPTPMPKASAPTSVAAFITAAVFAVTALLRYCSSVSEMTWRSIFLFLAAGLAAIYFILFANRKLNAITTLLTGFGTILWFACILVSSYFDLTVPMNAPLKLVLQLACLGGMLLMLAEMRLACAAEKKRFYLFALASATLYLCVSSIPSLIAAAAGLLAPRDLGYADFACLALGLFGIVRLVMPFGNREDATAEAEESTDATADESESEQETEENPDAPHC